MYQEKIQTLDISSTSLKFHHPCSYLEILLREIFYLDFIQTAWGQSVWLVWAGPLTFAPPYGQNSKDSFTFHQPPTPFHPLSLCLHLPRSQVAHHWWSQVSTKEEGLPHEDLVLLTALTIFPSRSIIIYFKVWSKGTLYLVLHWSTLLDHRF